MTESDTLREAANLLRRSDATAIERAVADWLNAEATVVEAIPPLVKLFWGIEVAFQNGLSSVIEGGEKADGEEQLRASSTAHGLAVAHAVLAAHDD